jgi:ABC-2 type transport system permease protein
MMFTLFKLEAALLLRSRICHAVGILLLAALTLGALNGQHHAQEQAATIERIAQDVESKLAAHQAAVQRYRQPAEARLAYWQDPSDAAGYMRYGLHAYAVKQPWPLAGLAVGQSRLLPYYLKTDLDYVAPPAAAYDFINPRFLALGEFDLAFVLAYILPLAVIALGASRLSAERDSGALLLIAAQAPSFRNIVLLKGATLAAAVVPYTVAASALALLIAGIPLQDAGALPALAAALCAYALFWVALTTLVASRIGVVGSYLRLVSVWIVLTFLVPAGGALVIGLAAPPPSKLQFLDELRTANDLQPAERNATFAAYVAAQAPYAAAAQRLDKVPYATKQVAVQHAVERRSAQRNQAAARQQQAAGELGDIVRALSPALVMESLLQRAAGNGAERHQAFLREASAYTDRLRSFFWPRALREAAWPTDPCPGCAGRMNFTAHADIPRFTPAPAPARVQGLAGGACYLWLLAGAAMLLLARRRVAIL